MNVQVRQGDVFLERIGDVDALPGDLQTVDRDRDQVVLAYGESTGHCHAIVERNAELFAKAGTDERWLVIRSSGTTFETGGATLRHEEHAPITLEPGVYRVITQREYSPGAVRRVVD